VRSSATTSGYLLVPEPPVGEQLRFALPLPASELVLAHRTREIRARLRGDAVVAMDHPPGADLTFFPPL
jgi:hypothetical protein